MSLAIFSVKNLHHKNGIWWFTKMANAVVGEQRYDALRVSRRVMTNKFYYMRQQMLYQMFVEQPDVANLLGVYPKVDSSHGFGYFNTYEMYRDFQENTINSDGSFGMWILYIAIIYVIHEMYNYFLPWYWNKNAACKNGEEERIRMRDCLSSTVFEDSTGLQVAEWGWMPHDFHLIRNRIAKGLAHPDDIRAQNMNGLNRKHRYVEHYMRKTDEQTKMVPS